jgi:hypothetical protein
MAGAKMNASERKSYKTGRMRLVRLNTFTMNTCAKIAGGGGLDFIRFFEIPEEPDWIFRCFDTMALKSAATCTHNMPRRL